MEMMCINIINSKSPWYEAHCHYKDALLEKDWIEIFLKRWGFPPELSEHRDEFEMMAELRTLLTEAMDAIIAGEKLSKDFCDELNRYFAGSAMHYEAKPKDRQVQLILTPQKSDWVYVRSEIAASFVRLINELDATRLKRCENQGCHSVFYDSSKNRVRKWCCNTCSSLIKVRRYRQKNKT